MSNIWIEKYKPSTFKNYIDHDIIKNIIIKLIDNNNFHNLILYGPPGTGKTTIINICAKYIYGVNYKQHILELNGSDERGINIVRENIHKYANTNTIYSNKFKLIILDEIDSMTQDAQNALKEIIETYEYNVKFCLICNFINKIIYPLQSCCIIFRLPPICNTSIKLFLKNIIKNEKIKYNEDGLNSIIEISMGDIRKSCNNLHSVYLSYNNITKSNVYESLGIPKKIEIKNLFNNLKNKNLNDNMIYFNKLKYHKGYLLNDLIKNISDDILNKNISDDILIDILIDIAKIEENLCNLGTEIIQTYSFIAVLYKYKKYL
jgi:replication factor C subunit 3/5